MNKPVKRILIIGTDRIGEFLLALPLVDTLREYYPQAHISVLVRPESVLVAQGYTQIDQVIPYPDKGKISWWLETAYLLKTLSSFKFSLVLVAKCKKAYHLALFLKRIPIRIGFNRKWAFFLTHRLPDDRPRGNRHEIDNNLLLVRPLLGRILSRKPDFVLDAPSIQWAQDILSQEEAGRPLVILSPFSSDLGKEWDPSCFTALAHKLCTEAKVRIVFLGAPEDLERGQNLEKGLEKKALNLCGQTTLKQAAAIVKQAAVLVSNDSALVHIASSLDVPTVVLFRNLFPEDGPQRWGPFGKGHEIIQVRPGEEYRQEPGVDMVYQASLNLLTRHKVYTPS